MTYVDRRKKCEFLEESNKRHRKINQGDRRSKGIKSSRRQCDREWSEGRCATLNTGVGHRRQRNIRFVHLEGNNALSSYIRQLTGLVAPSELKGLD